MSARRLFDAKHKKSRRKRYAACDDVVEAGGIATPQLLRLHAHGLCDRSLKGRNLPCGKPSFSIPPF